MSEIELTDQQRKEVEELILKDSYFKRIGDPICGWEWLLKHAFDVHPEQWIEIKYDDKVMVKVGGPVKHGAIREAMKLIEGDEDAR